MNKHLQPLTNPNSNQCLGILFPTQPPIHKPFKLTFLETCYLHYESTNLTGTQQKHKKPMKLSKFKVLFPQRRKYHYGVINSMIQVLGQLSVVITLKHFCSNSFIPSNLSSSPSRISVTSRHQINCDTVNTTQTHKQNMFVIISYYSLHNFPQEW